MADIDVLTINPNKTLWEKGDFTQIAQTMRASGEELVSTLDVRPGMKVLDLGCGDGTTAVPEARKGADVLGIDIAENLVSAGNRRAKALGLSNLRFQQGDASNLDDVADDSFDLVVSVFGAMFAPRPADVAKEMVRVTRPGGLYVSQHKSPVSLQTSQRPAAAGCFELVERYYRTGPLPAAEPSALRERGSGSW